MLFEGGRYRSNQATNYLGTFTFASLDDYLAGRPSAYTRRVGDPNVRYTNLQVGVYAQDDWRARRSLMVSYGVRYEAQNLVHDRNNVSPRSTLTWAPFKDGKTTFRAGAGVLHDWLGTSTYEQTLRVDGERQREINIFNPGYPDPGSVGAAAPANRYLLDPAFVLPTVVTANAGMDRVLAPNVAPASPIPIATACIWRAAAI